MDQPTHPAYPAIPDAALRKTSVIRGLVVLCPELTILHINKPAADLARYLRRQAAPPTPGQVLPTSWLELGQQVREAMQHEEATQGGRAVHVKRTISEGTRTIALSGFGLLAGDHPKHSRILLITEEHCPEQLAPTDLLRYRFLLTHIRAAQENGADGDPNWEGQPD